MDVAVSAFAIAAILAFLYTTNLMSENRVLKGYVEFYKVQLRSAVSSLESGNDHLQDAIDEYRELHERYHELCDAYARAYEILEENGLLPEDTE